MRVVPSFPVVAKWVPSGDQATALTAPLWPVSTRIGALGSASRPSCTARQGRDRSGVRRAGRTATGRDGSAVNQASIVAATRAGCATVPGCPPSRWACRASQCPPPRDHRVVGYDTRGHGEVRLAGVRAVPRDPPAPGTPGR